MKKISIILFALLLFSLLPTAVLANTPIGPRMAPTEEWQGIPYTVPQGNFYSGGGSSAGGNSGSGFSISQTMDSLNGLIASGASSSADAVALILSAFVGLLMVFFSTGNIGAIIAAVVVLLPLAGFFMIILGLMKYVLKISLFKDGQHNNLANYIAIGVALIATLLGNLFLIVVGVLAGSVLTLLIMIFVVFALIIFINKSRGSLAEINTGMNQAIAGKHQSRKDRRLAWHEDDKAARDVRRETRLLRRERKNINKAQHAISGTPRFGIPLGKGWPFHQKGAFEKAETVQEHIEALAGVLAQISSLGDEGATPKVKQQLLREAQDIAHEISGEYKDVYMLKKIMNQCKQLEKKEFQVQKDEAATIQNLKDTITKLLNETTNIDHGQIDTKLKQEEEQLLNLAQKAHELEGLKNRYIKNAESYDGSIFAGVKKTHEYMREFIQAVNQNPPNLTLANKVVLEARNIIREIEIDETKVKGLLDDWKKVKDELLKVNEHFTEILNRVKRNLKNS